MKKRRLAYLSAVGVAALAVLTACSSPDAATDDTPVSPLSEYFEAIWGTEMSPKEQQREFEERQKETEEIVAQCMADEGFEYTPNVQDSSWVASDDTVWEPDDREWVAQYGYGYVNSPQSSSPETEETYEDPNQDYVDGLSMSEQTAYYVALYGETTGDEEYDWKTAGCMGAAQHEVSPDPMSDERFADLNDAISDFWTESSTDPVFAELEAEWSDCMADAGQPGFSMQADAAESISDDINAYWEKADPEEDPESDADYQAIGEEEVELALVDLDCREKTDYTAERAKIQATLEEQFIADHKAELEEMKAAAEQAG